MKDMPARGAVRLCLLLSLPVFAAEPPAIRRQGVVNAASQRPAAVGGAIARGSRIAIHGIGFAAAVAANRVELESGGRVRQLLVLHADPKRLDAWIPPDVPPGPARLTVTANGLAAAPETLDIRPAAPGLFSADGEGRGPARSGNTPGNSVAPGGRITLAATGLARGDKPEIRVGNAAARVLAIRPAGPPDYTAEISIQTPADAPEGCYVPVYARLDGAPPSNAVTIAIHRGGGPCVSAPEDPAAGWNGGKTAILLLSRTVRHTADAPRDRTEDEMVGGFFDVPAGQTRASPLLLLPPQGACTGWAGSLHGDTPVGGSLWSLLFGGISGEGLNAGDSLALHSRTVQLRVPFVNGALGLYRRILSPGRGPVPVRNRLSFDAGRLGIAGAGGPQVGPFAVAMPVPEAFAGPSRSPDAIGRSRPVTLEWSAGPAPGILAVAVIGADANLNVAAMAYCVAPEDAGRLTIPADLLAPLPPGPGSLVMASWTAQRFPPPSGIARMEGLSVFARIFETRIE